MTSVGWQADPSHISLVTEFGIRIDINQARKSLARLGTGLTRGEPIKLKAIAVIGAQVVGMNLLSDVVLEYWRQVLPLR